MPNAMCNTSQQCESSGLVNSKSGQGSSASPVQYQPVVLGTRQSRYGYWIVTISRAPGFRMDVVCAILGITSKDAESMIIEAVSQLPHARSRQ